MPLTVRDLMSLDPPAVRSDATIESALTLLLKCEASELYIIDEFRRLLGVVPDYAFLKARLIDAQETGPITQIMSASVATLTPALPVAEAAPLFREGRCRQMPVVEAGRLVGQLARNDVLRMLRSPAALETGMPCPASAPSAERRDTAPVPAPRFLRSPRSLAGWRSAPL